MNVIVLYLFFITFILLKFTYVNSGIVSRIQTIIDQLGLSVSAFADAIGVQRSSISHLLNGRNKPSLDFVIKLVQTYPEIDLYWLLKGEGSFYKEEDVEPAMDSTKEQNDTKIVLQKHREDKSLVQIKDSGEENEPYQIVLLYKDGTFKTFSPKKD
ncbi:MAG: helix-turn-helix transcriptional regulator [Algicola sp.]|nr:helix-turn-helix transcriptional regulator [Algicola sp.]